MDWLPMEFITYTGQERHFRMLVSFFFLNLVKTNLYERDFVHLHFLLLFYGKWTFHPFVFQSKRIYTVLIWCRILAYLVVSQCLRIVTFYSTQLPGPNYHCRDVNLIKIFPQGVIYGCGDLIFSSHMIFTLVFVSTYKKYGTRRCIKQFAWLPAVVQSLLIIASRKHYTIDIVVAWYTVNLVAFFLDRKLPEPPDRSSGSTTTSLLPLSIKNKDGKNKEEH
ncbi:hypothetical protein CRYUN_Cryun11dG0125600 [Craigia yunnanensis]